MNEMPGLAHVGRPEDIVLGRTGTIVGAHGGRRIGFEKCRVPAVPGRDAAEHWRRGEGEIVRRGSHPAEEGLPDGFCLLAVESQRGHLYVEPVAGVQAGDLTPTRIEKARGVELDEAAEQPAKLSRRRLQSSPRRRRRMRAVRACGASRG